MQTAFLHQQRQNIILLGAANNIFLCFANERNTAERPRYATHPTQKKPNALDENEISQPPRLMRGIPLKNSLSGAEFRACRVRVMEI
jgi:hypothetical protein